SAGRSGAGCARSRRTVPVGSDRSSRVTPAARIRRQHRIGRAEVKSGVSRALKAPAPGYIYACTQIAFHVEHAEKGRARTLKLRNEPNLVGKSTRRRAPSPCPLPEGERVRRCGAQPLAPSGRGRDPTRSGGRVSGVVRVLELEFYSGRC